jgi:D-alanine-D-alanine ligase
MMDKNEIKQDWWKSLFDEFYLITDARTVLSDELTKREVDLIIELTGAIPRWKILDLCGGQGRHSAELKKREFHKTIVYDYSSYLTSFGRKKCNKEISFLRGDAREIGIKDGVFDLVIIMGNSFGYFSSDDENKKILSEAHRVIRPGGVILLDIINRNYIEENFRPKSVHHASDGILVTRTRELFGDIIRSREVITSEKGVVLRENRYQEKLYDRNAMLSLIGSSGFEDILIHENFSSLDTPADLGFMESRMVVRGKRA